MLDSSDDCSSISCIFVGVWGSQVDWVGNSGLGVLIAGPTRDSTASGSNGKMLEPLKAPWILLSVNAWSKAFLNAGKNSTLVI